MKNKSIFQWLLVCIMILTFSLTAFSGQWISSNSEWYYKTDDGFYAKNAWLWLDEDHDGIAHLYHFDNNGIMSKSTQVTKEDEFDSSNKMIFDINSDGIITGIHYTDDYYIPLSPKEMPPYAIYKTNTYYRYALNNGKDFYDFKDAKNAKINNYIENNGYYSDRLTYYVDCGNYYAIDVDILVYDAGTDGNEDIIKCVIPTKAYFSKDCICNTHSPEGDKVASISKIVMESSSSPSFNFFDVTSTDSNGFITSCNMRIAA